MKRITPLLSILCLQSISHADSPTPDKITAKVSECLESYKSESVDMDCLVLLQDISITCTNFPNKTDTINCSQVNSLLQVPPCNKSQSKTINQFKNCYELHLNKSNLS